MNKLIFLTADTKSIVQTNTLCTMLVDKNVRNGMFCSGIGGWITGLQTFNRSFATALEPEPHDYRHIFNNFVC